MSDTPPDDAYRALGYKPDCFSALAISQLAVAERSATAQEEAHLATCEDCAAQLADEQRAVGAARSESVPRRVVRTKRRFPRAAVYAACFGAMAASILVLAIKERAVPPPQVLLKGGIPILVTVVRDGVQEQTDTPIEALEPLPPNVQLVIRLGGPGIHHVQIESFENARWETLFRGPTSPEGALPNSLRLTPGPTRLRVTVCDDADFVKDCQTHDVHF